VLSEGNDGFCLGPAYHIFGGQFEPTPLHTSTRGGFQDLVIYNNVSPQYRIFANMVGWLLNLLTDYS